MVGYCVSRALQLIQPLPGHGRHAVIVCRHVIRISDHRTRNSRSSSLLAFSLRGLFDFQLKARNLVVMHLIKVNLLMSRQSNYFLEI